MPVWDVFSKRERRAKGQMPDVFQYSTLPEEFRVQVAHILQDIHTPSSGVTSETEEAYHEAHNRLCREYGLFTLAEKADPRKTFHGSWQGTLTAFLMSTTTDRVLDVIEVTFSLASSLHNSWQRNYKAPRLSVADAVTELNTRFREHGIGFQFERGEIIRTDSQFLHAEVVKPALAVLSRPEFAGANAEFLAAHQHYRHGRHAEAMNDCLKAFESSLKIICKIRRWKYKETDTARTLLETVFSNGLVPAWLQSEFGGLRSTLESGVPTARNRVSGHGRGDQPREVPDYFAAYLLHMTAAAVVFLAEAAAQR